MTVYPWFRFVRKSRTVLCLLGVLLSVYSLYDIEDKSTAEDESSNASLLHSINSRLGCPKVHSSKYAIGFGIVEPLFGKDSLFNVPNSISGVAFYMSVLLLGFVGGKAVAWFMVIGSILSCLGCAYLAYILHFLLHQSCLVSVFVYVISALLLVLNTYHLLQILDYKSHNE